MKLRPMLALTLLFFAAGCAKQAPEGAAPAQLMDEPSPATEPPPSESKPPSGSGGITVCASPECDDACADAGDRMTACVEAFAAGCFSDVPPEDYDCNWQVAADGELEVDAKAEEASDEEPAKRAVPTKSDFGDSNTPLRTEELID